MTAKHIVDVGLIVAQVNQSAAVHRLVVRISTDEENLAASLANSEIGAEINQMVFDRSKACLQLGAKTRVAIISLYLMPHSYDAELRRMRIQICAELLHNGVEVETRDKNAVTDSQLAVFYSRTQVEATDTQRQHLLHRFCLHLTCEGRTDSAHTREGTAAGIVRTRNGELADEGIVIEACHPVLVVSHLRHRIYADQNSDEI